MDLTVHLMITVWRTLLESFSDSWDVLPTQWTQVKPFFSIFCLWTMIWVWCVVLFKICPVESCHVLTSFLLPLLVCTPSLPLSVPCSLLLPLPTFLGEWVESSVGMWDPSRSVGEFLLSRAQFVCKTMGFLSTDPTLFFSFLPQGNQ